MDRLTKPAEEKLLNWPGIESVYTRVGKTRGLRETERHEIIRYVLRARLGDPPRHGCRGRRRC